MRADFGKNAFGDEALFTYQFVDPRLAHEIYDACTTEKRLVRIEGGMHRDLYVRDAAKLAGAIDHFLARVSSSV